MDTTKNEEDHSAGTLGDEMRRHVEAVLQRQPLTAEKMEELAASSRRFYLQAMARKRQRQRHRLVAGIGLGAFVLWIWWLWW